MHVSKYFHRMPPYTCHMAVLMDAGKWQKLKEVHLCSGDGHQAGVGLVGSDWEVQRDACQAKT